MSGNHEMQHVRLYIHVAKRIMAVSEYTWTEEHVEGHMLLFVCLYITQAKDYFNCNKIKRALDEIAAALGATSQLEHINAFVK